MDREAIEEIDMSFLNGQKPQARDQIKKYGVKKFFIDFMNYLDEVCPEESNRYRLFKNMFTMYYFK